MGAVEEALGEFYEYLEGNSLSGLLTKKSYIALIKTVYKRYHALLVWQTNLVEGNLWLTDPKKDAEFRLYFNESVSDLCQSFLLFCHGMYKPSNLVLRSGIESFVKAIGLAEDQKILTLTSLLEVFDVVANTNIIASVPLATRSFRNLQNNYADLCKYVHIAGRSYMSLSSIAGSFPKFDGDSKYGDKAIRSTIVAMCSILGVMFNVRFKNMHHSSIDLISDILPKHARQEIMAFGA